MLCLQAPVSLNSGVILSSLDVRWCQGKARVTFSSGVQWVCKQHWEEDKSIRCKKQWCFKWLVTGSCNKDGRDPWSAGGSRHWATDYWGIKHVQCWLNKMDLGYKGILWSLFVNTAHPGMYENKSYIQKCIFRYLSFPFLCCCVVILES